MAMELTTSARPTMHGAARRRPPWDSAYATLSSSSLAQTGKLAPHAFEGTALEQSAATGDNYKETAVRRGALLHWAEREHVAPPGPGNTWKQYWNVAFDPYKRAILSRPSFL